MFRIEQKYLKIIRKEFPSIKDSTFKKKIGILEESITHELERFLNRGKGRARIDPREVEINQATIRKLVGKVRPTANNIPVDFWAVVKKVCGADILGEQIHKGCIIANNSYLLSVFRLNDTAIASVITNTLNDYKNYMKYNTNKQPEVLKQEMFYACVSPKHVEAKFASVRRFYKKHNRLPDDITIQDLLLMRTVLRNCFKGNDGKYYIEQDKKTKATGRIYMVGPRALQGVKKSLRPHIFGEYYDIDIENSAMNLKMQMAVQSGYTGSLDGLENYVKNTKKIRNEVAQKIFNTEAPTSCQLKQVKQALTAISFGAKATSYATSPDNINKEKNSIVKILSASVAKKLFQIDDIKNLVEDLKSINRHLMRTIDFDQYFPCSYDKRNQKLAHSYQSCEKHILDIIMREVGNSNLSAKLLDDSNSLIMPMHDGIMSKSEIDVSNIENIIFKETGYRIKLLQELITTESF